jgi:aspartate-semialdehyde dehydrogenase
VGSLGANDTRIMKHPEDRVMAVVGATGAVGREFLAILEQRHFAMRELRLFASRRSAGMAIPYAGKPVTVRPLEAGCFKGVDLALFSAGSGPSKEWGPRAVDEGATVIDNSSAFRMTPGVPLVVPEVNPEALEAVRSRLPGTGAIIANPNCSTIIMLMAVTPIRRAFGVKRIVVSTYQAVSGAGAQAMEELAEQTRAALAGVASRPKVFAEPCAFNVFSHNSPMDASTGRNTEEQKMVDETRKIWNDPPSASVRVTATCVRVPVMRAHAESINLTLDRWASEADVRRVLESFPGVRVVDDRVGNVFPTPLKAAGRDETLVGRIRGDESQGSRIENGVTRFEGFNLFVASDQIRKGAALNAIQIAEMM